MHSDPADRPSAAQVFHRIAKTADASQLIKPLASRSAASSFESGRLATASDSSVRSVLGADAANQQATSTDADSDAEAHLHDADLPVEEADSPPETDAGHSDLPAEQVFAPVGAGKQPAHHADQSGAEAADTAEVADAAEPRTDQADPPTNKAALDAAAVDEPAEAAGLAGVEAASDEDVG